MIKKILTTEGTKDFLLFLAIEKLKKVLAKFYSLLKS